MRLKNRLYGTCNVCVCVGAAVQWVAFHWLPSHWLPGKGLPISETFWIIQGLYAQLKKQPCVEGISTCIDLHLHDIVHTLYM